MQMNALLNEKTSSAHKVQRAVAVEVPPHHERRRQSHQRSRRKQHRVVQIVKDTTGILVEKVEWAEVPRHGKIQPPVRVEVSSCNEAVAGRNDAGNIWGKCDIVGSVFDASVDIRCYILPLHTVSKNIIHTPAALNSPPAGAPSTMHNNKTIFFPF